MQFICFGDLATCHPHTWDQYNLICTLLSLYLEDLSHQASTLLGSFDHCALLSGYSRLLEILKEVVD